MEQEFTIKEFAVQTLPAYRQPVVELLITSGMFEDFDLEDYDALTVQIFDAIVEQHLLDAHLRENLQPDSHD